MSQGIEPIAGYGKWTIGQARESGDGSYHESNLWDVMAEVSCSEGEGRNCFVSIPYKSDIRGYFFRDAFIRLSRSKSSAIGHATLAGI